ncbi:osteoglycin, paralog a [Alosa sapidissima]|uniref:osteoglycin, paralog a n=1 Tax=Alosa sapidissima TaxID=34773 RepID=UPI001C096624|nr:osteoglycin, paralog a [Alosa sapidissima]
MLVDKMANIMRSMFFTFIFAPWVLSASARQHYHGAHSRKDIQLNEEAYLESRFKRDVTTVTDSDYDSDSVFLPADAAEDTAPGTADDLPTCLLCVCLTGSVYCEEVVPDMTSVPALPKETAYLYARYNKIKKITAKDFEDIVTLRRIDLTGNLISEIEDGAFLKLTLLEDLSLAENQLVKLPMLPAKLISFNANHNHLKTKGVKANAFKKLTKIVNIFLAHNELEAVPQIPETVRILHLQNNNISSISDDTFCKGNNTYYIRPNMNEIRLDGNPVNLAQYPNSFTCLKSLPIGRYH